MMQSSHLIYFKQIFESQIRSITPPLIKSESEEFDQQGDVLDHVSTLQERVLNHTLQNRKRASIQALNAALERIRMGSFGICEDCNDDIDLRRLEINPIATVCIQCQEARERYSTLKSAV